MFVKSIIDFTSDELFVLLNLSNKVICPVCGIGLKKFRFIDEHNSYCPRCRSVARHRAFALIYKGEIGRSFPKGHKKILHFAAEKFLIEMICKDGHDYKTADFESPTQKGSHYVEGRDIMADMTCMPHYRKFKL